MHVVQVCPKIDIFLNRTAGNQRRIINLQIMKNDTRVGDRAVAIWLLLGVAMIMIQVVLGGITRLTGSGLSITEWKPILGAMPPTTEQAWQNAFHQYQQIGQYKQLNTSFTLEDFKGIYFWEWFHRLWARLLGVVFIIGFVYLIAKKYFRQEMIRPMIILFLLGGVQGAIGWIMVKSGLNEENIYVDHIRLAIHFISALGLLVYTFWFALQLLVPRRVAGIPASLIPITRWMMVLLVVQLIYGAFMAGLKAAPYAVTWPTINGEWFPSHTTSLGERVFNGWRIITDNPLVVQFIHRSLAYVITILSLAWFWLASRATGNTIFTRSRFLLPLVVVVQVVLGIFTVMHGGERKALLWLGVTHQFVAMLFLLITIWMLYLQRRPVLHAVSEPATAMKAADVHV
jgi:heme a synthase